VRIVASCGLGRKRKLAALICLLREPAREKREVAALILIWWGSSSKIRELCPMRGQREEINLGGSLELGIKGRSLNW
jgi:hypothetical protein